MGTFNSKDNYDPISWGHVGDIYKDNKGIRLTYFIPKLDSLALVTLRHQEISSKRRKTNLRIQVMTKVKCCDCTTPFKVFIDTYYWQ